AEGFEQIINFLSGSYIHYALTVSPPINISCIKQFWKSVAVKRSGDVTRLQALVDKKKIVISEAVIHEILQLNDAEGVVCLPNEEISAGLAQMGYEKPSTKLTFYKAFFSSHWKFLIHTILQSLSAKRTSWNKFSTTMASTVIYLSKGQRFNFSKYIFDSLVRNVDSSSKFYMYPRFIQLIIQTNVADLSTHTTRYISLALTQKVFANMRRFGKGFSGVETPLFKSMLVVRDVAEEAEAQVPAQGDNVQELAAEEVVPDVVLPTPTPPSPPSSVLATCSALALRVEGLESDKADDMENVFNQGRKIVYMDQDEGIELVADQEKDAEFEGRHADKQAKIYNIDLDHSSKVLSMQEDDTKVQEAVEIITTAKLMTKVVTATATQVAAASIPIPAAKPKILTITAALAVSTRRRKGVVIRDPEEELPSDTLAETPKVKDKGKGILTKAPKPMKKKDQIEMDAELENQPTLDSNGNPTTLTERVFETYKNVTQEIRDQLNAEAEAVQIILTGIDNDIYSTVDACPNACEMWKAIERIHQNVGYENQRSGNVAEARETVGSLMAQKSGIQCYNCKEFGHVARECQKPKRTKDAAYHREKMLLYKQEEAGIQLNADQTDWKDDTDDESHDQELEAHYIYKVEIHQRSSLFFL
nr:hypothetical protein [Tanacetum cinerariifolium]